MGSNSLLRAQIRQQFIFVYNPNHRFFNCISSSSISRREQLGDFGLSKHSHGSVSRTPTVGLHHCRGPIPAYTYLLLKDSLLHVTCASAREGVRLQIRNLFLLLPHLWTLRSQTFHSMEPRHIHHSEVSIFMLHVHFCISFIYLSCLLATAPLFRHRYLPYITANHYQPSACRFRLSRHSWVPPLPCRFDSHLRYFHDWFKRPLHSDRRWNACHMRWRRSWEANDTCFGDLPDTT